MKSEIYIKKKKTNKVYMSKKPLQSRENLKYGTKPYFFLGIGLVGVKLSEYDSWSFQPQQLKTVILSKCSSLENPS